MKKTKLYLNHAGYCIAKENDSIKGGRKQKIQFHALWGLIEHPEHGYILYDTGYTQRFYEATKRFPNKIYGLITKVEIEEHEEVANQLRANGIDPAAIKHVIITHFHADHVAGLKDFPNATFYASKRAFEHTKNLPRSIAFSKGVLKQLLPLDLEKRVVFIDEKCSKVATEIFGHSYDLFSDNSIQVYDLPGHAAGQIGIRLETEKQQYFLIADACWLKRSYQDHVLPNPVVRLFFHSWKDFKLSLKNIHSFHQANPTVLIVPTHCSATTLPLIQPKIDMNVL